MRGSSRYIGILGVVVALNGCGGAGTNPPTTSMATQAAQSAVITPPTANPYQSLLNPAQKARPPAGTGSGLSVSVPNDPYGPASFTHAGVNYNGDGLLDAVKRELAAQLAQVTPQTRPLARTLRVVLPPLEANSHGRAVGSANWARAGRYVAEYYDRHDRARVDALRRAGLFERVEIDTADVVDPSVSGSDYVLYKATSDWMLKNPEGKKARLMAGTTLPVFIGFVQRGVDDLRRDDDSLATHIRQNPDRLIFAYNGVEYTDVRELERAVRDHQETRIKRGGAVSTALGGRAKIIVPTNPKARPLGSNLLLEVQHSLGFSAYVRALNDRNVELIKRAKMFDSVVIERGDIMEPLQDSYDWLLWQRPDQPLVWFGRAQTGDLVRLSLSRPPEELGAFVADQLRKSRR